MSLPNEIDAQQIWAWSLVLDQKARGCSCPKQTKLLCRLPVSRPSSNSRAFLLTLLFICAGLRKSPTSFPKSTAGDTAGLNSNVNALTSLKNQFMKRKFKPHPTTQNEIRECKARLSRGELLQYVTAGNKKIDFGVVAVGSENSRMFDVSNVSIPSLFWCFVCLMPCKLRVQRFHVGSLV